MVIYVTILVILFILWFLFVFNFYVEIKLDDMNMKVYLFRIRVLNIKKEKLKKLIIKNLPKDSNGVKKDIDYGRLIVLMHINKIDLTITTQDIENYNRLSISSSLLIYTIKPLLDAYIGQYNIKITVNNKSNLLFDGAINFNVGIILLNILLIKVRYRNGKTIKRNA